MAAVHDRMPVILEPQAFDRWLDPDLRTVKGRDDLFRPYPESPLLSYPVCSRVNSPAYDSPGCIEPISPPCSRSSSLAERPIFVWAVPGRRQ